MYANKQERRGCAKPGLPFRAPGRPRRLPSAQTELAQELGVSQRMISYYEGHTEYPPVALLPGLAELLGVTADELLGMAPLKKSRQPDSRLLRRMQQIEKLDAAKKRQVLQMIDTVIENEQLKRQTADGGMAHANG